MSIFVSTIPFPDDNHYKQHHAGYAFGVAEEKAHSYEHPPTTPTCKVKGENMGKKADAIARRKERKQARAQRHDAREHPAKGSV